MFNKNRKGSTLALTLIIFAVLMIFATFILNFMVTENKQAMYHQNKTQAYYLARSGAVAVEKAVNDIAMNDDLKYNFIENEIPTGEINTPNVDFNSTDFDMSKVDVTLYKIYNGSTDMVLSDKTVEAKDYSIVINSQSSINGIIENVKIVIPTKLANIKTKSTNAVLVYLDEASEALKKLKDKNGAFLVIKGDPSQYQLHNKTDGSYVDNTTKKLPDSDSLTLNGDYYVNKDLDLSGKTITVTGTTNIYVKGGVRIYGGSGNKETSINYAAGTVKNQLNFYVYYESSTYAHSLQIGEPSNNDKEIYSRATFYVKTGSVDIHVHKLDFESDVFTNGEMINVTSHSNSNQHIDIKGTIIAPKAIINLGSGTEKANDKVAVNIIGLVVGDEIWYLGKNIDKLVLAASGINDNYIPYTDEFFTTVGNGYFK